MRLGCEHWDVTWKIARKQKGVTEGLTLDHYFVREQSNELLATFQYQALSFGPTHFELRVRVVA
jgi:hypothetical protein